MTKAEKILAQAQAAPLSLLPSVADLGRLAHALSERTLELDDVRTDLNPETQGYHDIDARYDRTCERLFAVRDLILSAPITSLADAATVAVQGWQHAELEGTPTLERALARLAVFSASAANVPLGELLSEQSQRVLLRQAGTGEAVQ